MIHAERFSEQGTWAEAIKAYRFALISLVGKVVLEVKYFFKDIHNNLVAVLKKSL